MAAGWTQRGEPATDLARMRVAYPAGELDEADLAATWHEQLAGWLEAAVAAGLPEPNAMVLATTGANGLPSSRTVLAKALDSRGVVFYTNLDSQKMNDINATRFAAATFPWIALHRQAHLRGPIELITLAENVAYWQTRPRGTQLGAWASAQSTVVRDRWALDDALEQAGQRFADTEQVPLPAHWGGVRIRPVSVEFWQGRPNRMHDRLRYQIGDDGRWTVVRLAP
ncbi:MAG TPA: pyridoxamine 5'-phosphate oxidase [Pseudonocardiaceae bacterium]|nr:pyridoxamine 5'-phosphate oxidase [Pseudonocardiaceae bacterium]